jgi:hypothetical protein
MYKIDNPSNLKSLAASLEMIDFQRDDFGKKVEEQFASLIAKIKDGTYKNDDDLNLNEETKAIEKLTFDRLGIRIAIHKLYKYFPERLSFTGKDAATIPLYLNVNSIFLNSHRGDKMRDVLLMPQMALAKRINNEEGTVDEAKAVVGGFFSKYTSDLLLDVRQLSGAGLTASEITGVYLHEIGHVFTTMATSNRYDRLNQVLSNLAGEQAKGKKLEASYVYKELSLDTARVDRTKFIEDCGKVDYIPGSALYKGTIEAVTSQMREGTYDQTASEQSADSFAARFGYGRGVVTGLDKIYRSNVLINVLTLHQRNKAAFFVYNILEIGMMFFAPIGRAQAYQAKKADQNDEWYSYIPWFMYYPVAVYCYFRATATDMKDWTYDDLYNRYKRIRNEVVSSLKDTKMSKDQTSDVIVAIKAIDDAMAKAQTDHTILARIANMVFWSGWKAKTEVDHQRMQEELAANEIFVKAAELRS